MEKFIYVFNTEARDALVKRGYVMLKADDKNSVYVFENRELAMFDLDNISYALSSTLTF